VDFVLKFIINKFIRKKSVPNSQMNYQCNYNSMQSRPSVPAVLKASRLSEINKRQMNKMDDDVQLSRTLIDEFEEMIEPTFFDRQLKRPLIFDAKREAYYKGRKTEMLKRAKSRNPTL